MWTCINAVPFRLALVRQEDSAFGIYIIIDMIIALVQRGR